MEEYLVEGHLGGYYISNSDPEIIEAYCETCGDSDRILTSWDYEVDNARLNALLSYFLENVINDREALKKKIESFYHYTTDLSEIIDELLYYIEFDTEGICNVVTALYEDKEIDEIEKDKIITISNMEKDRQFKMIKLFLKSHIDSKEDDKVMKLNK